jgi:hypothetical protein
MKIEITDHFTNEGKEFFRFELYDGPDGIEHVSGFSSDLIEAFSKIIEWRERISQDYYNDIDDETDY